MSNDQINNCNDELLSAYLDGEVTSSERKTIELHLTECSTCADSIARMRNINATLVSLSAPRDLHSKVMRRVSMDLRKGTLNRVRRIVLLVAAVVTVLISGVMFRMYLNNENKPSSSDPQRLAAHDVKTHAPTQNPYLSTEPAHNEAEPLASKSPGPPAFKEVAGATSQSLEMEARISKTTLPQQEGVQKNRAEDMAALDIKLPPPYFGGTPLSYFSGNLEERTFAPRRPFLAPRGVQIVSRGKTVTSSDASPTFGNMAMLTDGEKGYEKEHLVELAQGTQWAQIDLGEPCEVYAVLLWHFHAGDRVYFDVAVRAANDADFTRNVHTLYNNDHDNTSGLGIGKDKEYIETNEGRLIACNGEIARYVRCYSNGNTTDLANHYIEIEVWGLPVLTRD